MCLVDDGYEHAALRDMYRIDLAMPDEIVRQQFIAYYQNQNAKGTMIDSELVLVILSHFKEAFRPHP